MRQQLLLGLQSFLVARFLPHVTHKGEGESEPSRAGFEQGWGEREGGARGACWGMGWQGEARASPRAPPSPLCSLIFCNLALLLSPALAIFSSSGASASVSSPFSSFSRKALRTLSSRAAVPPAPASQDKALPICARVLGGVVHEVVSNACRAAAKPTCHTVGFGLHLLK